MNSTIQWLFCLEWGWCFYHRETLSIGQKSLIVHPNPSLYSTLHEPFRGNTINHNSKAILPRFCSRKDFLLLWVVIKFSGSHGNTKSYRTFSNRIYPQIIDPGLDRINSANNNLLIIIAYYMPTVQIAHFYILCKGTSTIKNNLMQHWAFSKKHGCLIGKWSAK